MKKALLFSLALIGLNLCFTSCSTDYDSDPNNNYSNVRNPLQGTFTAKINDVHLEANEKTVVDNWDNGPHFVSITGLAFSKVRDPQNYQTITLTIPDYSGLRTYFMDDGVNAVYNIVDSNGVLPFLSYSGDTISQITITKDDGVWEGKFRLAVLAKENKKDTVMITEGTFSIPK